MERKSATSFPTRGRSIVVSSVYSDADMGNQIGREAYSYRFVYKAFAPLLERWGQTSEVACPESRLDYSLMRARQARLSPIHLSFLPLHFTYLTAQAPNVVFPFWEFPDIPNRIMNHSLRFNWVHVGNHASLILTACQFTHDAFVRAGVKTPVRVVPVPIAADYFGVPAWEQRQSVIIDCPAYVFPQPEAPEAPMPSCWVPPPKVATGIKARTKQVYKKYVKPRLPERMDRYLTLAARSIRAGRAAAAADQAPAPSGDPIPFVRSERLELSGVVFTTILNPFDPRKNWQDLMTSFLRSLGDRPDATLVFKLVVCPQLAPQAVGGMAHYYRQIAAQHRCKVVFITDFLSERQMVDLARASTYYCNSARAEGSCLPLQNFLAAGRPGITANHTAITDYFQGDLGFTVESHPEPTAWPHDPSQTICTHWHRLVWQSLHDQLRSAYDVATQNMVRYQSLASRAQEQMIDYASLERVWPRLSSALDLVGQPEQQFQKLAAFRKAS